MASLLVRTAGLLALLLVGSAIDAAVLDAQYFGRNKVQYEDFDFNVLSTPHFRLYYYEDVFAGDREPVYGAGATLRFNLSGFIVLQYDLTRAFERDEWVSQLGFVPGF